MSDISITDRQRREREYHKDYARRQIDLVAEPISLRALDANEKFRWWNAYWVILRRAQQLYRPGARALVIGCGFGDDAVQLAAIGYSVTAVDISPESVEIAQKRTAGVNGSIDFLVSPAENTTLPHARFDLIYCPDVLHHIDIPRAMLEARRLLKPTGRILANEPYTHSLIEQIRQSQVVRRIIYPRLVSAVYGTDNPYITEDERKLTEKDLRQIRDVFTLQSTRYFLLLAGRLVSANSPQAKVDRIVLKLAGLGYLCAGRIVIEGHI